MHRLYRHNDALAEKHVFYTYFTHFFDKYTTIKRPNTLYTKHVMYLYLYYVAKEGILGGESSQLHNFIYFYIFESTFDILVNFN